LSPLVFADINARALKQKTRKMHMVHELYFDGQLPERSAGGEAGNIVRIQFDPEATTENGASLQQRIAQ
jgi:hypothetical protein